MFNFNIKGTTIENSVKWGDCLIFKFSWLARKAFFAFFTFFFVFFLFGFFSGVASQDANSFFLGFSIVFLVLFFYFYSISIFRATYLKKPKPKISLKEAMENPGNFNLAEFLSYEAARAVLASIKFTKENKFPVVDSTILFYTLLCQNRNFNFIFSRLLINFKDLKKTLKKQLIGLRKEYLGGVSGKEYAESFQLAILESVKAAHARKHLVAEKGDLLIALSKTDPVFKGLLVSCDLKPDDVENLVFWLESLESQIALRKRFWDRKNLLKKGSLAKHWSSGFTNLLDKFSIDLSEIYRLQGFPETVGHQKELGSIERILSRQESNNNVLLVGEAGSGRKSIVQALAVRSAAGESLPEVNFKRVVQLDLMSLLAQINDIEEAEQVLDSIFQEVIHAGNVVLVIDEFHNYVGKQSASLGTIDISGVLSSYLPLISFQIVAITTFEGLHRNIEQNSSVLGLFEKVDVSEISDHETLLLLEKLALNLEAKYKKFVSYPALRNIIDYCSKYLPGTPFPEKAMELLDELMIFLVQRRENTLLPSHVAKIVSEKTEIPVGEIESKEREILLNLENLIHQKIINQEEAVREVSAALRRSRAEVTVRKGPMGCFLFLGPTGVGKTETSKVLAEIYFGSESRMIRLDMSEFQSVADIKRLIGSPGEEGLLTTKIRECPFSLVLLDEIEKAHPNILNLFLQVLDEGFLTDGVGRKVDFRNSIIIATSNAGYQVILEAIKQNKAMGEIKAELLDFLFKEGVFRPEFINRFDSVVVYKNLTKENTSDIAQLLLQKLKKNLKEKNIDFIITDSLKEKIVELGYNPTFGAREMRRVIQDKVENVLASGILSGRIKRGDRVEVDSNNFELIVNK